MPVNYSAHHVVKPASSVPVFDPGQQHASLFHASSRVTIQYFTCPEVMCSRLRFAVPRLCGAGNSCSMRLGSRTGSGPGRPTAPHFIFHSVYSDVLDHDVVYGTATSVGSAITEHAPFETPKSGSSLPWATTLPAGQGAATHIKPLEFNETEPFIHIRLDRLDFAHGDQPSSRSTSGK